MYDYIRVRCDTDSRKIKQHTCGFSMYIRYAEKKPVSIYIMYINVKNNGDARGWRAKRVLRCTPKYEI